LIVERIHFPFFITTGVCHGVKHSSSHILFLSIFVKGILIFGFSYLGSFEGAGLVFLFLESQELAAISRRHLERLSCGLRSASATLIRPNARTSFFRCTSKSVALLNVNLGRIGDSKAEEVVFLIGKSLAIYTFTRHGHTFRLRKGRIPVELV
jgi:hypothetical protein